VAGIADRCHDVDDSRVTQADLPGEEDPALQAGDATRRTHLANERTYLAWWRTGIATLAASIAVGRVVPSLTHETRWPYTVLGAAFALVAIVTLAYAFIRQRNVRQAISRGGFSHPREDVLFGLTVAGVLLGLLVLTLVIASD
jgi:putative membrane protein